jgi:phosphotransferase system enzyme I (PtsP)
VLSALQQLVQQVNAVGDIDQALRLVVQRVKDVMEVDVCSIYIRESSNGQYVLMASEGLSPHAVGQVRLSIDEGLVGYVAARQELINLDDAAQHPNFRYFPETGEERFHGFLGVPLVHFRKLLGVLVVQQVERRLFGPDEVAFLVTVAAQLAGVLNSVAPDGAIVLGSTRNPQRVNFRQGLPGAPGVAVGTVVLPSPFEHLDAVSDRVPQDLALEETAFLDAVGLVQEELRRATLSLSNQLSGEVRSIIDVYALMLDDATFVAETVQRIRGGNWAPGALRETVVGHARVFEQMADAYLRARAEDVRAIGQRILLALRCDAREPMSYPERCILVGDEVSLARIVEVPAGQLSGIVSLRGSVLSHTAIIAKAMGVPAVMGLGHLPLGGLEGRTMIVDGHQGRIFIDPDPNAIREFERLVQEERAVSEMLRQLHDVPAETLDGTKITLNVNIGLLAELNVAAKMGTEGVGLYRTEFPFLVRNTFPLEEEQYAVYRKVLEAFAPRPVTMRTLDVGGDKPLPYYPIEESNPALGWRGIRFTLDHPEIFLPQLRALLRANVGLGNLRILFPMVSNVAQVREARMLLDRAQRELREEGHAASTPEVGVMIEVPSAVYELGALAAYVDFFSVGTNDLTQYLLAVDRDNPNVWDLYDGLHPAVLRALRHIVRAARRHGKPVTVCGEMAGDPTATLLLLGLGFDSLSMSASSLLRVKWVIRSIQTRDAKMVLREALGLDDAAAIRQLARRRLEEIGLGGLLGASRST